MILPELLIGLVGLDVGGGLHLSGSTPFEIVRPSSISFSSGM